MIFWGVHRVNKVLINKFNGNILKNCADDNPAKKACMELKVKYEVAPGKSWGNMPEDKQLYVKGEYDYSI